MQDKRFDDSVLEIQVILEALDFVFDHPSYAALAKKYKKKHGKKIGLATIDNVLCRAKKKMEDTLADVAAINEFVEDVKQIPYVKTVDMDSCRMTTVRVVMPRGGFEPWEREVYKKHGEVLDKLRRHDLDVSVVYSK